MNEVEDAQLLERSRRGEESAFSELYRRIRRASTGMRSICAVRALAMTSSRKRSWRCSGNAGARMRRDRPSRGTLFGIARHVVLQRLGSKYEPLADSGDDDVSEVASGALTALDNLTRSETIAAVRAAVQSLPPVYREAVVLCDLQEMEYAAAAGVLQCPIGTVRSRLSRARALLVTKLGAVHSTVNARRQ